METVGSAGRQGSPVVDPWNSRWFNEQHLDRMKTEECSFCLIKNWIVVTVVTIFGKMPVLSACEYARVYMTLLYISCISIVFQVPLHSPGRIQDKSQNIYNSIQLITPSHFLWYSFEMCAGHLRDCAQSTTALISPCCPLLTRLKDSNEGISSAAMVALSRGKKYVDRMIPRTVMGQCNRVSLT